MSHWPHVLITGAAGNLGGKLVRHLTGRCPLTLLDRVPGPEIVQADLAVWSNEWVAKFQGAEVVVHLAGNPVAYADWTDLVGPNIDAMIHVYEAAALAGVRRVVFASSNHVMGGYRPLPDLPITTELPPRPGLHYLAEGQARFSGAYAATKLMGERLGRHYATQRGLEVIAVRLGWVWRGINLPAHLPTDREEWFRLMWLSDRDYLMLLERCLVAPLPERFHLVNGMSGNTGMRWDLTGTRALLGYDPQDNVHTST